MPEQLIDLFPILGLLLAAVALAVFVIGLLDLAIISRADTPDSGRGRGLAAGFDIDSPGVRFLFDGQTLVLASRDARDMLAGVAGGVAGGQDPWARMLDMASADFPDLAPELAALDETGVIARQANSDGSSACLRAERRFGLLYLDFDADPFRSRMAWVDKARLEEDAAERDRLRCLVDDCPIPAWIETGDAQVVWANPAYQALVGGDPSWPYRRVFEPWPESCDDTSRRVRAIPTSRSGEETDASLWYDVWRFAAKAGQHRLFHAVPATDAVRAEQALKSFVVTLTDTFSHLTTALAVFDRDRRLTLFNPAFVEMTGLDPAWASGRPTLKSVLDTMRELRVIPEPKDYYTWRDRIIALEQSAQHGCFAEEWPLADGRTLRVVGRPHPRGAVAFLFEDITPELSHSRRMRAELELGSAVLDGMEEAVVVFSETGTVLMANAAYTRMWGVDPNQTLAETTVEDCIAVWTAGSMPSSAWAALRSYASGANTAREPWRCDVALPGRGSLQARFQPLPGGRTLAAFHASEWKVADIAASGPIPQQIRAG